MTFMNCFTQLNNNCMCGFRNFFTPQIPICPPPPLFTIPFFNFGFNFNFNIFNPISFNWNNTTNWANSIGWNTSVMNFSPPMWNTPSFNDYNFANIDTFIRTTPVYTAPIEPSVPISRPRQQPLPINISPNISGYNQVKGEKLAQQALGNANYQVDPNARQIIRSRRKPQNEFTHQCARYVKIAIRDTGLGAYEPGHGYQMADILRRNQNFKEVNPNSVNYRQLPPGCILVYGRGVERYSTEYGHVEITLGDGRAVSDGITHNIRKPTAIFIPV